MGFKAIISGQLDFYNERSYNKTIEMCKHKMEVLYKDQVLLKIEDIFDEEKGSIIIPRFVKDEIDHKRWRNTLSLLNYIADFAISGSVSAWLIEERKIVEHYSIEPSSDKTVIKNYRKGREILDNEGSMEEAKVALNKAIKKFERHGLAYERRGFINHQLKNYDDAIYDYTKSINFHPHNAGSYYGRALIYIMRGELEKAIDDLDKTVRNSIAHESIYWKARKLKGECYIKLEEYSKAAFEFKLFTNRKFAEGDPNIDVLKDAFFLFGRALLGSGEPDKALEALKSAKELKIGRESFSEAEWKSYHQQAVEAAV
jgi:tetratricopeptide (TPR) repeat protein